MVAWLGAVRRETPQPPTTERARPRVPKMRLCDEMPEIFLCGTADMRLCVPGDMSDAEIIAFANAEAPPSNWIVRPRSREVCRDRDGWALIMLDRRG